VTKPDDSYEVGYRRPPKHTQFPKGQSGNPKGRPKGSQNLATVLQKVARQRVKVTSNGRPRSMTKLEAAATQLSSQAASGNARAIREFLSLHRLCEEPAQADPTQLDQQEIDRPVIQNILKRLLQSEEPPSANETNPETTDSSEEVH
jgi:phosphoenolpyruvate carboxylase